MQLPGEESHGSQVREWSKGVTVSSGEGLGVTRCFTSRHCSAMRKQDNPFAGGRIAISGHPRHRLDFWRGRNLTEPSNKNKYFMK